MNHPLIGPKLKIERAMVLWQELRSIEHFYFSTNDPEIAYEITDSKNCKIAKLVFDHDLPATIYHLTAEVIYHLRSSLDQLSVSFAKISNRQINFRKVSFPCGDDQEIFLKNCDKYLKDFDKELSDFIRSTNAYYGADDTLRAIFYLANIDKHIDIIPVGSFGNLRGIDGYDFIGGGLIIDGSKVSLKEGIVISEMSLDGEIKPNKDGARMRIYGHLSFGDVPKLKNLPLLQILVEMVFKVQYIYYAAEKLCVDTGRITL